MTRQEPSHLRIPQVRGLIRRSCQAATIAAAFLSTTCLCPPALAQDASDPLAAGFSDPPASARPFVWWHWMNGNITQDGIAKDLEWMKRIGVGGVQTFDANLSTPQVVDRRLAYMTPEWKEAFRFAAMKADSLGLELGIASSPGWSETGGPWVQPRDAMKKLVWSELSVTGGHGLHLQLPHPPSVVGPFQQMPREAHGGQDDPGEPNANFYQDVAVLAYPIATGEVDLPQVTDASGQAIDALQLAKGEVKAGARISAAPDGAVTINFARPQTIRSATLFMPKAKPRYGQAPVEPYLEASTDGKSWTVLSKIAVQAIPTTVSFAPTTARWFRVSLRSVAVPPVIGSDPQPGVVRNSALEAMFAPPQNYSISQLALSGQPRVDSFELKAGFAITQDYYALSVGLNRAEAGVDVRKVVDLTKRVKADGMLDWTPPKGSWRIVRLGYSLLGTTNHPATAEATGLEVDKYDGAAVRSYMNHYLDMYRDTVGPDLMGAHGIRALLTDSIEVGAANWTSDMIAAFKARRGYDPTPWLPALTGALIGTRAESDAFLYDFRRTLADLIASEHYGVVAAVAHERGLKIYGEALEDNRPMLGDDLAMRSHADVPMAAMWTFPRDVGPRPTYLADDKGASSVGHIYGRRFIAAESMTAVQAPWAYAPSDLRRFIDLEFALGINRPIIHTSVHQPVEKAPGLSLSGIGQFFNRHEAWAELARPWTDYIARSSFLLQQGRNVADIAYFYGEEGPVTALYGPKPIADAPTRYAFDFLNSDALESMLSVENGMVATKGGARYRAIYLGGSSSRMTLPTLRRLASLAEDGATVIGKRPVSSPGLGDDSATFDALADRLWSGAPVVKIGKGQVIASGDVEAALGTMGVGPDFTYAKMKSDSDLMFVHRSLDDGEVYFVVNRKNRPERTEARFRVAGRTPEIWRADTGARERVSYRIEGKETVVPLDMGAEDSFFIVFRKPAARTSAVTPPQSLRILASIAGSWHVSFEPNRGAPASIILPSLASLSENSAPDVKYFSGVATYKKTFELSKDWRPGAPLTIDLGQVGVIAEVIVNGKSAGYAWRAPYRVDISSLAKRGRNSLEVRVADLWVNRLIGDAQAEASNVAFTTFPTYTADAPLRPSGLIGPVTLLAPDR